MVVKSELRKMWEMVMICFRKYFNFFWSDGGNP
jgi:hypothetical protein